MSYPSPTPVPGTSAPHAPPGAAAPPDYDPDFPGDGGEEAVYEMGGSEYGDYLFNEDESVYTEREHIGPPKRGRQHVVNNRKFVSNDRGHQRIFITVNRKKIPIEFFMTKYTPGTPIRNAVSGIREKNLLVGKSEEASLFKVGVSLPDIGQDRYGSLYYDSPEQYERHFYTTVPQSIKEKWLKRVGTYGAACA